jgi:salicylate hydroxylase
MRGVKEIIGTTRLEESLGLTKPNKLKVAIIGAGVSGLCSALFLKRLGHEVTVFEKDKSIKNEGAGIQITSNGLHVLEKLDLRKTVVQAGLKPNNLCLYDEDDFKRIGSLEILNGLKRRYGRSFIALHRPLLIKILFQKVKAEKIKVKFGSKALPLISHHEKNVSISYKGEEIKKDLIVVADGVSSAWKKTIFTEIKARSISQAAYRFLLSKKNLPSIFSQNNINLFFGRGRHFVTYPTGNEDMINFVFCKREKNHLVNDWKEKVTKQQFFKDFELNECLRTCVSNVKTNVVLVGDAAHGMLPYLAQGANKALEDSWELATHINTYPLDLNKSLKKYSEKRIKRIQKLDKVSRLNEKIYHLEQKVLRAVFLFFLRCMIIFAPRSFFKRLDWIYSYKG